MADMSNVMKILNEQVKQPEVKKTLLVENGVLAETKILKESTSLKELRKKWTDEDIYEIILSDSGYDSPEEEEVWNQFCDFFRNVLGHDTYSEEEIMISIKHIDIYRFIKYLNEQEDVDEGVNCKNKESLKEYYSERLGGDPEDFITDLENIRNALVGVDVNSLGTHLAQQIVGDFMETLNSQASMVISKYNLSDKYNMEESAKLKEGTDRDLVYAVIEPTITGGGFNNEARKELEDKYGKDIVQKMVNNAADYARNETDMDKLVDRLCSNFGITESVQLKEGYSKGDNIYETVGGDLSTICHFLTGVADDMASRASEIDAEDNESFGTDTMSASERKSLYGKAANELRDAANDIHLAYYEEELLEGTDLGSPELNEQNKKELQDRLSELLVTVQDGQLSDDELKAVEEEIAEIESKINDIDMLGEIASSSEADKTLKEQDEELEIDGELSECSHQGDIYMMTDGTKFYVGKNFCKDGPSMEDVKTYSLKEEADEDYLGRLDIKTEGNELDEGIIDDMKIKHNMKKAGKAKAAGDDEKTAKYFKKGMEAMDKATSKINSKESKLQDKARKINDKAKLVAQKRNKPSELAMDSYNKGLNK